ncbi:MAG: DegV family protein [Clostridia bacterium]|jgi:DegV family protein with EDD domain
MMKVKIFTDSTADLSEDLLERYHISVVPLYVVLGETSYLDGVQLITKALYEYVDEHQTLPKTSAPTVGDFYKAFKPWLEDGYDIVYIGLSSKLSATHQSALLAAQDLMGENRVYVVDSQNLSTGIGLLVLEAAELALEGLDAETIHQRITEHVADIRSSFIIDTLKYLHMGGRCSSIQLLAGSLLSIRPQIIVKDGGMIVGEKYRGNRKKCLDRFYNDYVLSQRDLIDRHRIFVTHSAAPEDALYYKERLMQDFEFEEILITEAGSVISSHCGPKTIGILYRVKDRT